MGPVRPLPRRPDGVDAFSKLPCTPALLPSRAPASKSAPPDTLKVGRNNLKSFGRWAAGTCTWDQYIARP